MADQKVKKDPEYIASQYLSGKTLQEIADEFGCSRERIRQILIKNGFIVRSAKNFYKNARKRALKPIADDVLVESTNRIVEQCYERQRNAEMKLKTRIQFHQRIVNKYMDAIGECWKLLDDIENNNASVLTNLKQTKSLLKKQLIAFGKYKRIIKEKKNNDR